MNLSSSSHAAFITGASSGIGEGIAVRYARPGNHLGLVARRRDALLALQQKLEGRGARASVFVGDVADTDFLTKAAAQFMEETQRIDVVVANAGMGIRNAILEGEAHEIARLLYVNVVGVTNTVVPFVPRMIEQGSGVLCAVGSFAGHRALPGRSAYSASKAAVNTFMDGLRMDLAGTGVHSMTVCPGFVETQFTAEFTNLPFSIGVGQAVEEIVRSIRLRRRAPTFPWQMAVLKEFVTRIPESWIRRLSPPARRESSQ